MFVFSLTKLKLNAFLLIKDLKNIAEDIVDIGEIFVQERERERE